MWALGQRNLRLDDGKMKDRLYTVLNFIANINVIKSNTNAMSRNVMSECEDVGEDDFGLSMLMYNSL